MPQRIAQKATKSKISKRIGTFIPVYTIFNRVSVPGVKSLGVHFACLCRGFDFYEVKKKYYFFFFKKKREILLIIFIVKSLQKEQNSTNLLLHMYDPQSAGINLQLPQSDSTPWTLTLPKSQ